MFDWMRASRQMPLGLDLDGDLILSEVALQSNHVICRKGVRIEPEIGVSSELDLSLDADTRGYAAPLRRAVDEHHWTGRKVAMVVPAQHLVMRQLSLPPLPRRAMKSAIHLEISQRLQLPFSDPLYDYAVETGEQGGKTLVKLFAAPREVVMPWVHLIKHIGLRPVSMEGPSRSRQMLRLLSWS